MSTISDEALASLPVALLRDEILANVDSDQVTIITAETGAGKSTQVPRFLAEHGYRKVIVTQPRILAARNLASRVREEYSWVLGHDATSLVGYRTAHERDDGPDNVILYCTDGLQLVRELTGSGAGRGQVLVLDEVHEWNENMEVLVAWAKKRCREDPDFKLVLMSATIAADDLAAYFYDAPVITVPGRTYPVERRHGEELIGEIVAQAETATANILVFLPGKAEIETVTHDLQARLTRPVPVLPLHGQLEPAAQQRAFASYPSGKIVLATNVAQTSITIDDIDVVVDSGLERRAEVRSGVEGLFIAEVSQADCRQRAGRAGRTKPGRYILARLGNLPCSPVEERPAYGVPEIMRKHIDRVVLRLASIDIDIESLEFYHSPSRKTIRLAKRTLMSLGALTGTGQVTDIGRAMERFPVSSSYARMLVEASGLAVPTQVKLAAVIGVQEVGGIVKGGARYTGWRRLTKQTRSDLLAQYDVLRALEGIDEAEYDDLGIIGKNVAKAHEVIERLIRDLGFPEVPLESITEPEIRPLLMCIVSGQVDQIWSVDTAGEATHLTTGKRRELSNGTVVRNAALVCGTPFDLEVPTPKGLETLHLVNDVTAIDPAWLSEIAPDLFKVMPGKVYFDAHYGTLATSTHIKFRARTIQASSAPLLELTPENQRLFLDHYSRYLHGQLEAERKALAMVTSRRVPEVPLKAVRDEVAAIAGGAVSLVELAKLQRIKLSKLGKLETFLGPDFRPRPQTGTRELPGRRKPRRPAWKQPHQRRHRP